MSFDINPPSSKPVITGTANTQDGGAGNLGYFEREEKDEKSKKQEDTGSIFSSEKTDSFSHESDLKEENDDFSISKFIAQIILKIKSFLLSIFSSDKKG